MTNEEIKKMSRDDALNSRMHIWLKWCELRVSEKSRKILAWDNTSPFFMTLWKSEWINNRESLISNRYDIIYSEGYQDGYNNLATNMSLNHGIKIPHL